MSKQTPPPPRWQIFNIWLTQATLKNTKLNIFINQHGMKLLCSSDPGLYPTGTASSWDTNLWQVPDSADLCPPPPPLKGSGPHFEGNGCVGHCQWGHSVYGFPPTHCHQKYLWARQDTAQMNLHEMLIIFLLFSLLVICACTLNAQPDIIQSLEYRLATFFWI